VAQSLRACVGDWSPLTALERACPSVFVGRCPRLAFAQSFPNLLHGGYRNSTSLDHLFDGHHCCSQRSDATDAVVSDRFDEAEQWQTR